MAIGTPVDLGHNQIATGAASLAITTLAATSAADDIVLFHYCNNSTGNISSISDTAVNAYQVLRLQSTAPLAEMWFAPNAGAMVISSTITANFNGGTTLRHAVSAVRVPGMRTAGVVSQFSTTSPTGTATGSSAINFPALTQPEMLLFVMIATAAAPGAITWGSGFTAIGGNTATAFALPAYLIVNDAAPITDTPTWVNSILYRTLGGALPGATQSPLYALDNQRKIYLPIKRTLLGPELIDVPLALALDAMTPPGTSDGYPSLRQRSLLPRKRDLQIELADVPMVLAQDALTPPSQDGVGDRAIKMQAPARTTKEIADVPLSLAQDALIPPSDGEATAMRRAAQRNMRRAGVDAIPNLPLSTLASGTGGYGVTAGPGMSVHQGVQHSNAHGVGGNQTGNSGVEGIPHDAPQ